MKCLFNNLCILVALLQHSHCHPPSENDARLNSGEELNFEQRNETSQMGQNIPNEIDPDPEGEVVNKASADFKEKQDLELSYSVTHTLASAIPTYAPEIILGFHSPGTHTPGADTPIQHPFDSQASETRIPAISDTQTLDTLDPHILIHETHTPDTNSSGTYTPDADTPRNHTLDSHASGTPIPDTLNIDTNSGIHPPPTDNIDQHLHSRGTFNCFTSCSTEEDVVVPGPRPSGTHTPHRPPTPAVNRPQGYPVPHGGYPPPPGTYPTYTAYVGPTESGVRRVANTAVRAAHAIDSFPPVSRDAHGNVIIHTRNVRELNRRSLRWCDKVLYWNCCKPIVDVQANAIERHRRRNNL